VTPELACVLDVGKTHSKLALLDRETTEITWSAEHESAVRPGGPFRELDAAATEQWLIEALRSAPAKQNIKTIVPVAHGATAALIDRDGQLLALPDYEDSVFDSVRETYLTLRDPFHRTYSPPLPLGLNLGIQLFYLQTCHARLFERTAAILLYPQYWAWRLSGRLTREVTSLGCHTDLWLPGENRFSPLAARQGWAELFPAMRCAREVLGTLTPHIATASGLDPSCRVLCGVHDTNASYLSHVIGWPSDQPLTVIATGTWTVALSRGTDLERLRPEADMLANVDAFGAPVATARFMGGREYSAIAEQSATTTARVQPTISDLQHIIDRETQALPSFAPAGGPFADRRGELVNAHGLSPGERAALATAYVALMTELQLDSLGSTGDIIIDGPFARNPLFGPLLAALKPKDRIRLSSQAGGVEHGALRLVDDKPAPLPPVVQPLNAAGLDSYRLDWRRKI
jgi:L-fuculokinase